MTQAFGSDSKETLSTSKEMEKALGLRFGLHAAHKKHRTRTRAINVVVNSKEEMNSGRLEYCRKIREDPTRVFVCATTPLPPVEEFVAKDDSELPSAHRVREAELKRVVEDVKVIRDCIIIEHKDIMARSGKKHAEDLEGLKKSSMETMLSFLAKVKSNILLHTQVATSSFDARRIDFDALYKMEMDNLGYDVHCLSGTAWKEYAAKWRGLMDFYLEGGLSKTSVVVTSNIATEFVVENTKAIEERGRGDVAIEPVVDNIEVAETCDGLN
ncbi:hypothetical protein J1N35_043874 [Gossypium stocksii]|uniref:Uncharacterized protein n=1 Tax=Gossypium stocksii TaxID=47602 RepID=A0A9D3ZFH2_9ROSI|nr:hypothetical protein J1N35_043874 [Gossypium stocksii]